MYVGMGDTGVPISCPAGEQVTPIKAWVNSPNDPEYLLASNWKCVKRSVMAEQSGFTFSAGLKAWANPLFAVASAVAIVPSAADSPGYAAGLWLPIIGVAGFLWSRGGGR